jgi:hypothetical protein
MPSALSVAWDRKPIVALAHLLRFNGANNVTPVGRGQLPFKSDFFIGSDPNEWMTDVPSYGEVVYRGLYNGIDLIYRPTSNGVKYEFRVSLVRRYATRSPTDPN